MMLIGGTIHKSLSHTPYMHKVYNVFSTSNAVQLPILNLFDELWGIGLDRIQVGLGIRIRLQCKKIIVEVELVSSSFCLSRLLYISVI